MDSQKEIANLKTLIQNKTKIMKDLALNLKRQGRRISSIGIRYKAQQTSDGIFNKIPLQDPNFKDLEEYSELMAKQFSVRYEEMLKEHNGTKLSIQKLANEIKNKPNEDYSTRIEALKKVLEELDHTFQVIWSQEHFLALNYRLDISAKELERWTMIMQVYTPTPESVKTVVDDFFS